MSQTETERGDNLKSVLDDLTAEVKESRPGFIVDDTEAPPETDTPGPEQPEPEQPEDQEPQPPEYDTVLPDELAAELAVIEQVEEEDEEDDDELYDPRASEERRKRREAEKRAAFLERQLRESQQGSWRQEATDHFPLLPEPVRDSLVAEAKSHREFLRLAKTRHDEYVLVANRVKADVTRYFEELKAETLGEARAEAAQAWGRPTVNAGGARTQAQSVDQSNFQADYDAAKKRSLAEAIGVRMRYGRSG